MKIERRIKTLDQLKAAFNEISRLVVPERTLIINVSEEKQTRSADQNRRMWAMLADVSRQVEWHGMKLSAEEWKQMSTAALKRYKVVPGIDGGFVVIGQSTSKMSIAQMTEVIEFLFAFGAERGVLWSDPTDIINCMEE